MLDRRHAPRIELNLAVTAIIDGFEVPCIIKNYSDTGAFLMIDRAYRNTLANNLFTDKEAFFRVEANDYTADFFHGTIVRMFEDGPKKYFAVHLAS